MLNSFQYPLPHWRRHRLRHGGPRNEFGVTAEAGLTLVEMLVVLAILAIAAGAVALGIGTASRGPNVEAEARRLAARLQFAADDMMVSDRPLAVQWDPKSYRFLAWESGAWRELQSDALDPHSLPIGLRLDPGSGPAPLGADQPLTLRLSGANQRWLISYDGLTAAARPAS